MDSISRMLGSHPVADDVNVDELAALIAELASCQATCTICADACLSEDDVDMLAVCVALNLQCADVCAATARVISRVGFLSDELAAIQILACRDACAQCAEECEKHEHEHCRICAEMCRRCEAACSAMIGH